MSGLKDVFKYPASLSEVFISIWLVLYETKFFQAAFFWVKYLYRGIFILLPLLPGPKLPREPAVELDTSRLLRDQAPLFLSAYVISLIMSLVVTGIFAYFDQRFFPAINTAATAIPQYNFLDDLPNILIYVFVTPVYVALGAVILSLSWSFQRQLSVRSRTNGEEPERVIFDTRPKFAKGPVQNTVWITAALAFCSLFAATYQVDVYELLLDRGVDFFDDANAQPTPLLYWFLNAGEHGIAYNRTGFYYIALNVGLLVFTVITVLAFLSAAFSAITLTRYIHDNRYDSFADMALDLRRFALAFIFAKWLFLFYIVNTYIWRDSYLGKVTNLDATIIAYSIIGSMFLPIPAIIIQSSWYARDRTRFLTDPQSERPDLNSLIPVGWFRIFKNLANGLIALIFIDTVFGLSSLIGRLVEISPVKLGG